ncbi:MAG: outer membrane beta-barrel protein [Flavisolibacter sp.]|nr:outer membrane beta-barrel protein [Flavisolibacter sp.]
MKNKLFFLPVVFLFSALVVKAQKGETKLNVSYSAALPTGNFKNLVSENSFRGFSVNILHGVSDNISVGLATGFQDFYQKYPRQLYKLSDGSDLSAVLTYSIQTMPVLAKLKYDFTPNARIQPYAAIGAGANFIAYNRLFGEFGNKQAKIGFAARPEAGLQIPFGKGGAGFSVGASYNIMPFKQDDLKNLNNIGLYAGFNIPMRK